LLGAEKMAQLAGAHVLVVGLGGVGAWAAEMICRAGVGAMTIVDADKVAESNLNRQMVALRSTIGRDKSEVVAARLLDINSALRLTALSLYVRDEATAELLDGTFGGGTDAGAENGTASACEARREARSPRPAEGCGRPRFDFVVDAIDTLSPKVNLIKACLERGLPLVSSMGAGAKTDPTLVEIRDISKTHHCPLAHMLRKRLHREGIRRGFTAVFSPEPVRPGSMIEVEEENKKSNVGTISYMPAIFGCHCASVVIRGLIGELTTPFPSAAAPRG